MSRTFPEKADVSIVIPLFNEEEALPGLFQELEGFLEDARQRNTHVEILLADDGSEDGSLEMLRSRFGGREGIHILHWQKNRGVGYALRQGFSRTTKPAVVCYDSDATYPLSQAFSMVSELQHADIVTASPFMEKGRVEGVPLSRVLLSRILSFLYRRLPHEKKLSTYSCGFRAYRRECLERLPYRSNGFLATTEILLRAMKKGFRIREVPSTLSGRRSGTSKMPVFRTAVSHLRFLGTLYLEALFSLFRKPRERSSIDPHRPGNPQPQGGWPGNQKELVAWNSRLNQEFPMDKLLRSPNPILRFAEKSRRRVIFQFAGKGGGVLADLGPERGGIASVLSSRFRRVYCADIDSRVLKEARKKLSSSSAAFVQGDIQSLGLRSGLADVTLVSAVLEHLPCPALGVKEAVRITRRGGRVILCIPNDSVILKIKQVLKVLRMERFFRPAGDGPAPGHLHVLDRKGIRTLIPETVKVRRFFHHLPSLCYFLLLEKEE